MEITEITTIMKLCTIYFGLLTLNLSGTFADDDYLEAAKKILREIPLVDGHNDLPWNLQISFDGQLSRFDLDSDICDDVIYPEYCHTDIPKLREGMVTGQFWSIFTTCNTQYKDGVEKALELIDLVKRIARKYDYFFSMATTTEDIWQAHSEGKVASLLGIEGGHMVTSSLGTLRMFYELGVRYLTLAWNCNTPWADSSDPDSDELTPPHGGLTDWGKLLILEMNRMGMLVDLSHVSEDTMRDALNVSLSPLIFSHSSAYGICPHRRNVPDDVLIALKDNGGVVMVNFYNKFLNCTEDNRYEPGYRSANLDQIVDHMEYIRDLIGVDHIAVGSDFDGFEYAPDGLANVSQFPNVFAQMLKRGWSEDDVQKVVGLNILRVMEEAEIVKEDLKDSAPEETLIDYTEISDLTCKNLPDWSNSKQRYGMNIYQSNSGSNLDGGC